MLFDDSGLYLIHKHSQIITLWCQSHVLISINLELRNKIIKPATNSNGVILNLLFFEPMNCCNFLALVLAILLFLIFLLRLISYCVLAVNLLKSLHLCFLS